MKAWLPFIALIALTAAAASAAPVAADAFLRAVYAQEKPAIAYDWQYRKIAYPNGDVPADVGVCSDVVIRAYRGVGIDLQRLVHEDMAKHFAAYPKRWGLTHPDTNIDHRRVENLRVFFVRHGASRKITRNAADYRPGDLVTWNLREKGSLPHIGIVTGKMSPSGRPLILHNIGHGQVLEDMLFDYEITGHYRYGLAE